MLYTSTRTGRRGESTKTADSCNRKPNYHEIWQFEVIPRVEDNLIRLSHNIVSQTFQMTGRPATSPRDLGRQPTLVPHACHRWKRSGHPSRQLDAAEVSTISRLEEQQWLMTLFTLKPNTKVTHVMIVVRMGYSHLRKGVQIKRLVLTVVQSPRRVCCHSGYCSADSAAEVPKNFLSASFCHKFPTTSSAWHCPNDVQIVA